jgi:hypothetical protein
LRGNICVICDICVPLENQTKYPQKTRYAMINNTIISKAKRP